MKRLDGKVALVTGASRGIGRAIAERYLEEGARVIFASRKQEALDEVVQRLEHGNRAFPRACHIGQPEAVAEVVDWAFRELGGIDVLVNNAATNPHFGPMMTADEGAWLKTFEVNVRGAYLLTRNVAERWVALGRPGAIVNITSILGVTAAPMMGVYGMTKAAVISMTQTLAVELGGANIRVNAIAPGLVETRFAASLLGNEELSERFRTRTALGRHGRPEDITGPAVFLASDDSRYVTGHILRVDGGYLAQ